MWSVFVLKILIDRFVKRKAVESIKTEQDEELRGKVLWKRKNNEQVIEKLFPNYRCIRGIR
jgi:hypothetical protein